MGDSGGIPSLVDELANVLAAREVGRRRRQDLQTGLMAVDIFVMALSVESLILQCNQGKIQDSLARSSGLEWIEDYDLVDVSADPPPALQ